MQLNQTTFYNCQSYLAYLHMKICILIKHIIYEGLFSEDTTLLHQRTLRNIQAHLAYLDTRMYYIILSIKCIIFESLAKIQHLIYV